MNMRRFAALIAVYCAIATPSSAGGLFGDGGLTRGDIGIFLESSIDHPGTAEVIPIPDIQTFGEAVTESSSRINTEREPDQVHTTYEALIAQKTPEQLAYEASVAETLGANVSDICVTPATVCSVTLTITGSSCFCTGSDSVELGLVQ